MSVPDAAAMTASVQSPDGGAPHQGRAVHVFVPDPSDGVVEVLLVGPGKGNAMGPDFWRELREVFARLDADDGVRAVVLSGSNETFSYGLDLGAMIGEMA